MSGPNPDTTIRVRAPGSADPKQQGVPGDNWISALKDWAYQLTVLKVATYVGDVDIDTNAQGFPETIQFAQCCGAALYTVCDLIGGDITNVIPSQYLDNAGLRAFHAQQVAAAAAILPNNLKVLGDLVGSVLK